ncbi:MAG: hypothetical protein IJB76_04140 [Clostridia bacterium]|nr:hypothetical protein [Clostridia bacterium]
MNNTVKLLSLLLCIVLVFSFAACNSAEEDKKGNDSVSSAVSEEASEDAKDEGTDEPSTPSFGFDKPVASGTDLSAKEYTAVSALPETSIGAPGDAMEGYTYIDMKSGTLEMTGIIPPSENMDTFGRLYFEKMGEYSAENSKLGQCLAGGRIRFVTDAETMVLYAQMGVVYKLNHFSAKGAYGFDVYVGTGTDRTYIGEPGNHLTDPTLVHSVVQLGKGYKEVTVVLPLYGGVNTMYIGLPDDASVAAPDAYSIEKPICFYGSSITQGGCVTRPGLAYANILCFAMDAPCYNLGFSGSAKGEQAIAQHIASLDISAFVMDYDYNAPDAAHLKATHYDFYKTVREVHPDIPIIFMAHPCYTLPTANDDTRTAIVKATYDKAVSEGDGNVYYVDNATFFPEDYRDLVTVDNSHPNDIGHLLMAEAVYPTLKEALGK